MAEGIHRRKTDMEFALPLDKMTAEDKLAAMERLWDDLCRSPDNVQSPSWHEDVLSEREQRIREGKAAFATFDEAKERIRNSTR
jgi:hypothetical protein